MPPDADHSSRSLAHLADAERREFGASWATIGIFLLLAIGAIAYAQDFLMPAVLSFLLALVFSPVTRFLHRHGILEWLSALAIVLTLVVTLVSAAYVLSGPVSQWIRDAPEIGRKLERRVESIRGSFKKAVEAAEQVDTLTQTQADADIQEVVVRTPSLLSSVASGLPELIAKSVFSMTLLLFLLASGDMFYQKIVHVMPTLTDKKRALRIVFDIERQLSQYLFTITLINLGLGVAIGTAMWLIGMPHPLLFGVIGFAFNFIPYLGAIAGALLAGLVGLVSLDDAGQALLAAGAYLACTTIEGQFVTPAVLGRQLEMNTVVVFLSVAFWAWIWGLFGMLVAVPLLVAMRVFCDHVPQLKTLGEFLAAPKPVSDADEHSETADNSAPHIDIKAEDDRGGWTPGTTNR